MKRLDEAEVKDILRHKDKKIEAIHQKMVALHGDLRKGEDLLSSVALRAPALTGVPPGKGGHRDLGDILLKYDRERRRHSAEVREIMWQLVEAEGRINRVWACFHALAEPYYTLLKELYVENQLYGAVESSSHVSHKTFEKQRKEGIRTVIRLFESGMGVADLMRHGLAQEAPKKKKGGGGSGAGYRQVHMEDLLGPHGTHGDG